MAWTIRATPVSQIKRTRSYPAFGFIEDAIERAGSGYTINDGEGYFIVSTSDTIVPNFIVDLKLPDLPNKDAYKKLAHEMIIRSRGMLWFDSSQPDGFNLAWQLQLPAIPVSPLLEYAPKDRTISTSVDVVRPATQADSAAAEKLLTSIPGHIGGKTAYGVGIRFAKNEVWMLAEKGQDVGAAILEPQGDKYCWLDSFVLDKDHRHQGIGPRLFEALGLHMVSEGRRLVMGMSHQGTNEYGGVMAIGSKVLKTSYKAFLYASQPGFVYTPLQNQYGVAYKRAV